MEAGSSFRSGNLSKLRSLEDYLAMIFRGRWIILGTLAVVMGASVLQALIGQKVYKATSAVLIDTRQSRDLQFLGSTTVSFPTMTIQNELEILKSSTLARGVAEKLLEQKHLDSSNASLLQILQVAGNQNPLDSIATTDQVIVRLQEAVDFESVRQSDVIKITAKSNDPGEAALIANLYAKSYQDHNVYGSRARSRSLREFLEGQMNGKEQSLARAEQSLRKYMERKGVVSLDDESKRVIGQLSALEAERDAIDIEIQTLSQTLASYTEQIAQQEHDVAKVMGEANDPYIRLLQEQLAQLEVQLDVTITQNPQVVNQDVYNDKLKDVKDQIGALKAKLQKRTDEFLRTILPGGGQSESMQRDPAGYLRQTKQKLLETRIQLQALLAKRDALNSAIKQYDGQFKLIPEKSMEYARLQRERLSSEKLYVMLEEKYSEANITEQSQFGYVDIFDRAVVPSKPSSPVLLLNVLLGLFVGGGLGIALVFVHETFRERVQKPEDIEGLGLVSLSTVADMQSELRRFNGQTKTAIREKSIDVRLMMVTKPSSPIAESFRHLYATVCISRRDRPPKTILVTSPNQGEGKSTVASNLALAFAESGEDVLLLETDLRRPSVHRGFDVNLKPGLSELLSGEAGYEDVIQSTVQPNLHFLACGAIPAEPTRLAGSSIMKTLVGELKKKYGVLVFDSPPVLAVTDALLLSPIMDIIIIVVSAGSTTTVSLKKAVQLLGSVRAGVAGVVLNRFDLRRGYGMQYDRHTVGYYGYGFDRRGDGDGQHAKIQR